MRKKTIFVIIAVWISILPYLGFGVSFRNILFAVTGLLIVMVAYAKQKEMKNGDKKNNSVINMTRRKIQPGNTLHSITRKDTQPQDSSVEVVKKEKDTGPKIYSNIKPESDSKPLEDYDELI